MQGEVFGAAQNTVFSFDGYVTPYLMIFCPFFDHLNGCFYLAYGMPVQCTKVPTLAIYRFLDEGYLVIPGVDPINGGMVQLVRRNEDSRTGWWLFHLALVELPSQPLTAMLGLPHNLQLVSNLWRESFGAKFRYDPLSFNTFAPR